MMKTKFFICSVLIIMLTACIVSTGCTSTQSAQTPVQTIPPTVTTPSQTQSPTIPPAAPAASVAPTTVPTAVITTTQTPAAGGVSVTINSAVKKDAIGSEHPLAGNAYLVLDVTIQNNDKNKDFAYTDASFQILSNQKGGSWHGPLTGKFSSGLNNQLNIGNIPLKSKTTGQIVFGVSGLSNSYKFSVRDASGTELTRIDNINVP